MKVAVLLSGCGVFDGSEIHEAVFTLLALKQNDLEYVCVAPIIKQHHVVNHIDGQEMKDERDVFFESARIARGEIFSLSDLDFNEVHALVIPGGFGVAKNLSNWAFQGPKSSLLPLVKDFVLHCVENKKPIVALCISPTLIAKALEGSNYAPTLTLGTSINKSEYNISEIHEAIESIGSQASEKTIKQICVDDELRIISAPCYMMNASIDQVYKNVKLAIDELVNQLSR